MNGQLTKRFIKSVNDILEIQELPNVGKIPKPTVYLSNTRNGMSAYRAYEKVLVAKRELGIPTGPLPDGSPNLDDELWRIVIKAIIDEITIESKITSTSIPGTQVVASGGNAGGPIVVYGSTTTFTDGGAVIS
jgi:hypothetical protein